VNDQPHSEIEIVRGSADDVDAESGRRNGQRTVAREDGNVINFDGAQVEPTVQPNVEAGAKFEREAGGLVAIVGRALHGIEVYARELLASHSRQRVGERLPALLGRVVFDLHAAENLILGLGICAGLDAASPEVVNVSRLVTLPTEVRFDSEVAADVVGRRGVEAMKRVAIAQQLFEIGAEISISRRGAKSDVLGGAPESDIIFLGGETVLTIQVTSVHFPFVIVPFLR